jgi:nitroreductase
VTSIEKIIRERRTVRTFNRREVSAELIRDLLDVSVWAPYNSIPEPWRFIVFLDGGQTRFADMAVSALSGAERAAYDKATREYLNSVPAIVAVVGRLNRNQRIMDDVFASASALIQNFQLIAWEKGLGVVWKTQHYLYSPVLNERLGVRDDERIVGVLLCGFFDEAPARQSRRRAEDCMTVIRGDARAEEKEEK